MRAVPAAVAFAPDPYGEADAAFSQLKGYLTSVEARRMTESELERELQARGQELLRKLLQGHLATRSPGEVVGPVEGADGVERGERRDHTRNVETVFGTVEVHRTGYGHEGVESLHPLDAELNLPAELYSLEVRRRVAEEAARGSFDEAVQTLRRYTHAEVPKRQVEELVVRAAEDFETFYNKRHEQSTTGPPSGSILVLTVDGKGVVMHREDLREATRKAAERRRRRFKFLGRLTKGEKRHAKRMATVAAVYTIAPFVRTAEEALQSLARLEPTEGNRARAEALKVPRPRPENKRVWASVEKEPGEVIEEALREAQSRDPGQEKSWVAVVDGQEYQLELVQKLAGAYGVKLVIVLDIIHVAGYLWKAAHAFHKEGTPEIECWVLTRLRNVLEGKAVQVAAGMRRSATAREMASTKRKPVDRCAGYLLKYASYLRYDEYLAAGYPIASGVIEGACRHLVRDRMELTGARWRLTGAEAVLRLRALRASGDFEEYWAFHEAREYERNHAARYAGSKVPSIVQPSPPPERPRLKRIK